MVNPVLYFGNTFLRGVVTNQYYHSTFDTERVISLNALYPVKLGIYRQHVGHTCIVQDTYFEYEDSNSLIEGIQNAEFDEYLDSVDLIAIQDVLDHDQMGYEFNEEVYNAALIGVW